MDNYVNYQDFLFSKKKAFNESGFKVDMLNQNLFPFQMHIVRKALKCGKYAIFADCGLGKTIMQLEWASKVAEKTNAPGLIVAPLAVVDQTVRESLKFGINAEKLDIRQKELKNIPYVINYEQLKNINASLFKSVVLDESSILKNFEGKFRNLIINMFSDYKYKLCCTATPSPNDPMELGNHSEFLGIMLRLEVLAMYFVHDGGNTSKWRLKGHAVNKFYEWVSSWAIMLSKPSDIGFSDKGYDLMPIKYIEHQIATKQRNNGMLFNDVAVSATNFNQELRATKKERMIKAAEIANSTNDQYIVWVKHNDEGDILTNMINGAVQVKGSDSQEYKKDKLLGFADLNFRVLITKTKIAQFGLNYQNCHNQIFASLDFSFEGMYQAVRRSYRFGQFKEVDIHLVTTDTMQNVSITIKRKQEQFENMQKLMINNQQTCMISEMETV